MSFYFNIKSDKTVSYNALQNEINNDSIRFHWHPHDPSENIKGTKIYIPQKSTRGITISKDKDSYSVGINVIASEEDYYLAIDVTRAIANITLGEITPEDYPESINLEKFNENYGEDWVNSMKTHGTNIIIENVGNKQSTVSIGCCYMQYSIGPEIHNSLDQTNELSYYNSLVKHIQETQFFDLSKYQIPQIISTSNKDGSNQKTYVVFYPTGSQFLTQANHVTFPYENGRYQLPYEQISLIADTKFTKIDETQYTIEPLNEADYTALIGRIERVMDSVDEETIKANYQAYSKEDLDHEFRRITSIPNARIKIFALKRMTHLMTEYEKRGIPMPNNKPKSESNAIKQPKKTPPKQEDNVAKQNLYNHNSKSTSNNVKKPWWKFW